MLKTSHIIKISVSDPYKEQRYLIDLKLQRMSKKELIEQLERYRHRETLFYTTDNAAHIGHFEWDYEKDCLQSCSESFANLLDMSIEEAIDSLSSWEKAIELIHIDDQKRYQTNIDILRETGAIDLSFKIVDRNGKVRHIHEIGIVSNNKEGDIQGSFGIWQDVSDVVKRQRDLEYRDALTQQAEEITELGYFNFDLESETYNYISEGFARIHGLSREAYIESVNSREDDMSDVHADDYERLADEYQRHRENGERINIDYRIYRRDGEIRWIREVGKLLYSADGSKRQSLGVLQDITEQKEAQEKLEQTVLERTRKLDETVKRLQEEITEREKMSSELKYLANHDALTGLPSLRLCKDRLERSLIESRRSQQMTGVMFVDLDGFKMINDTFGHEFGDIVLKVTADRIRAEIRETDTVARIGGDEFIVIMSRLPNISIAERIANNLIEQISQPILIQQQEMSVSASLGIALYPEDGTTSEELIRKADQAMYHVKNSGKNNFAFSSAKFLN